MPGWGVADGPQNLVIIAVGEPRRSTGEGAADPITETGLDLLQCPADAVRAWFLVLVQLDSEGLLRA